MHGICLHSLTCLHGVVFWLSVVFIFTRCLTLGNLMQAVTLKVVSGTSLVQMLAWTVDVRCRVFVVLLSISRQMLV
jgi:hypothetical protein